MGYFFMNSHLWHWLCVIQWPLQLKSNSILDEMQSVHLFVPICLSVRPCVQKLTLVSAVGSQNDTNRSFLVRVKSEKYAFWVTLRPLGSMSQGEVKIHALQYSVRQSRAVYIKLTSVFHHLVRNRYVIIFGIMSMCHG